MSDVSVDIIKNRNGEAPDLPSGANISGVSTAATLQVTNLNPTHINASGVTTATTFSGSLKSTGTPTLGLGVTINSSGINISGVATAGIVSATTLYGDGTNITGVAFSIAPISYQPALAGADQELTVGIGITFTERIIAGTGNITLREDNSSGTVVENFGVGSSVTIANNTVTFTPTNNLSFDQVYHISYPSGAFTNTTGDVSYVGTAYTFDTRSGVGESAFFIWGDNAYGQLGQNLPEASDRSSPVQIPGTTWRSVSWGPYGQQSMATKDDSTMWVWGYNYWGELGLNNTEFKSSPTQLPGTTWGKNLSIGGYRSVLATKTNGTLWVWGDNNFGAFGKPGTNPNSKISSPVQIPGTSWDHSNWGKLAARQMGGGAIRTDNTLWVWGYNNNSCLGLNTPDNGHRSSPTQLPGTDWSRIASWQYNYSAIKTDGTLWTWGKNSGGQLGDNSRTQRSSPIQIPGTTWSQSQIGNSFQAAVKTDGTLWIWGNNSNGHLGQNNTTQYSSPVQIPGTTWSIVNLTGDAAVAKKPDKTLWAWGSNWGGSLGQNNETKYSSPVQIPGTWDELDQHNFQFSGTSIKAIGEKLI